MKSVCGWTCKQEKDKLRALDKGNDDIMQAKAKQTKFHSGVKREGVMREEDGGRRRREL